MLIAAVLVARQLGQDGYGEFSIVRTTINLFAAFGGLGLGLTANRFIAADRLNDKDKCGHLIGSTYLLAGGFGAILALTLAAFSGPISNWWLETPHLERSLRWAALLLLLTTFNGAQIGVLQGLEAFRLQALASILQGVVGLPAMVVGARFFGVDGAVVGLALFAASGVLVSGSVIALELHRQRIKVRLSNWQHFAAVFWRFSIPVALSNLAVAPFKWIAETTLARDVGFSDVGVFHASMTVAMIIIAAVSTLNSPLVSAVASNGDVHDPSARLSYLNLYGSWYAFLIVSCPFVLIPSLASYAFGASFDTSQLRSSLLLLTGYSGLLLYQQGLTRVMIQDGRMWFAFVTNVVEGATLFLLSLSFMRFGAVGLAVSYFGSQVVRAALSVIYVYRRTLAPRALIIDGRFIFSLCTFALLLVYQMSQQ